MSKYTQSELPSIELLKQLGYDYLDAKGEMYEVVLQERLEASLKRINPWLDDSHFQKVTRKILAINGSSLIEINTQIHQLITKQMPLPSNYPPPLHTRCIPYPHKFYRF